jgi:hypothetical protein
LRFGIDYDVPSTAETLGMFFVDILLYCLLAFYFDHVDESNRGKSYDKLFFLKPSYWCNAKGNLEQVKDKINTSDDLKSEQSPEIRIKSNSVNTGMNINAIGPEKLLNEQFDDLNKNGNYKIIFLFLINTKNILKETLLIKEFWKKKKKF